MGLSTVKWQKLADVFKKMGAYVINKNNAYNLKEVPRIITKQNGVLSEERHPSI